MGCFLCWQVRVMETLLAQDAAAAQCAKLVALLTHVPLLRNPCASCPCCCAGAGVGTAANGTLAEAAATTAPPEADTATGGAGGAAGAAAVARRP